MQSILESYRGKDRGPCGCRSISLYEFRFPRRDGLTHSARQTKLNVLQSCDGAAGARQVGHIPVIPFIRRNPVRARRTLKLEMGPDGVLIRSRVGEGYCYRLLVGANLVLIPATVNGRWRMSNLATFR
jgi:hypothetical protein